VATPPETSPVDFGAAVVAKRGGGGWGGSRLVYVVMDGAVWLWTWPMTPGQTPARPSTSITPATTSGRSRTGCMARARRSPGVGAAALEIPAHGA